MKFSQIMLGPKPRPSRTQTWLFALGISCAYRGGPAFKQFAQLVGATSSDYLPRTSGNPLPTMGTLTFGNRKIAFICGENLQADQQLWLNNLELDPAWQTNHGLQWLASIIDAGQFDMDQSLSLCGHGYGGALAQIIGVQLGAYNSLVSSGVEQVTSIGAPSIGYGYDLAAVKATLLASDNYVADRKFYYTTKKGMKTIFFSIGNAGDIYHHLPGRQVLMQGIIYDYHRELVAIIKENGKASRILGGLESHFTHYAILANQLPSFMSPWPQPQALPHSIDEFAFRIMKRIQKQRYWGGINEMFTPLLTLFNQVAATAIPPFPSNTGYGHSWPDISYSDLPPYSS